jgi:hypothetical protein
LELDPLRIPVKLDSRSVATRNRPVIAVIPSWPESGSNSEFSGLGDLRSDIPRQQVVKFADSIVNNSLDDETQISFRVEAIS